MRAAHGGDVPGMPRRRQPVVHCGPDFPPFDGRLADPFMPRDQQQDPVPRADRAFERVVDRSPGAIERMPMKVERPVGHHRTRLKPTIPGTVQGRPGTRRGGLHRRSARRRRGPRRPDFGRYGGGGRRVDRFSRQGPDGRRDLGPERGFLSGQRSHVARRFAGSATARCLSPTFRRPCARPRRRRPRKYRTGWRP